MSMAQFGEMNNKILMMFTYTGHVPQWKYYALIKIIVLLKNKKTSGHKATRIILFDYLLKPLGAANRHAFFTQLGAREAAWLLYAHAATQCKGNWLQIPQTCFTNYSDPQWSCFFYVWCNGEISIIVDRGACGKCWFGRMQKNPFCADAVWPVLLFGLVLSSDNV